MNEFEVLSAFVRIFEKGVTQTLQRLHAFDQRFSQLQAKWQNVRIDVGVPGLQQVQTQLNGINQQLRRTKEETDRVNTGFRTMRGVVTAIRAILAGAIVGFIARTTFEFEKLNLRLLAFTRNQRVATQLFRDLLQFSGRTFFDISELGDAAAQLLNMRVAVDSIIPSLRVLNDIAIATGRSIADISFPLIDIAQKQHASQRDLIQFAIRGLNIYNALSRVTGRWGNELEEAVTKGEIGFKEVTEALKLLASEMTVGAAAANTQTAKFKRAWNELKISASELAAALEPLTTRIIQGLADTAKSLGEATQAVKDYVDVVKEFYGEAAKGTETLFDRIQSLFGPRAVTTAKQFRDNIQKEMEEGWTRDEAIFRTIETFLNTGFKKAGEEGGEALVQAATDAIQEGMEEADLFGSDFRKRQSDALDKFAHQLTLFVSEFGQEAAFQLKQFPLNFDFQTGKFSAPLTEEFDQATRDARIFAEEFRASMEDLVPKWGLEMAAQMAFAGKAMAESQSQVDIYAGHLTNAFNKAVDVLELGESQVLEKGKNAVRSFLDQTELGIRLAAGNIKEELIEGDIGQTFKSIGRVIAAPFEELGMSRGFAGGLAGAFRAGSAEALKLRRTSLEFDQRQVHLLERVADAVEKMEVKIEGGLSVGGRDWNAGTGARVDWRAGVNFEPGTLF